MDIFRFRGRARTDADPNGSAEHQENDDMKQNAQPGAQAPENASAPQVTAEQFAALNQRIDQLAAENAELKRKAEAEEQAEGAAASAAEIAEMCATAGEAALAPPLLKAGATVDQAKARIEEVKEIRARVELARKSCPAIDAKQADVYIAAGTSLESVRADLFDKMAHASAAAPTSGVHQVAGGDQSPTPELSPSAVYGARAKARAERIPTSL